MVDIPTASPPTDRRNRHSVFVSYVGPNHAGMKRFGDINSMFRQDRLTREEAVGAVLPHALSQLQLLRSVEDHGLQLLVVGIA